MVIIQLLVAYTALTGIYRHKNIDNALSLIIDECSIENSSYKDSSVQCF